MTKEELNEINISQMSTNDRLNLFKKLDLEQKKENFLRFFEIDGNSSLFEQFPVEDRLEQYMKFIDAYFADAYYINHLQEFIQCYEMLSETEKINMAEITTLLILNNLGKNIEMLSEDEYKDVKINGLLNVVKNLSEENQKKYAKNVFEYCSDSMENINEFLLTFNKDSHSLVVFDVIDKLITVCGGARKIKL